MASDLKTLIKQRGVIKAQLTRIETYLSKVGSNPRLTDLEIRKTRLQELIKEFETVQFRIECLDESEEQVNVRIEFEELYFECCGEIESILRSVVPIPVDRRNDSPSQSNSNACSGQVHSIVPKIKIKDFDGNFAEWNDFHDAFKSVIHDDERMPVVHKFQLLKSHLQGDAAAVISVLNSSEENYLLAWESLNEEFNKPRKIIEAHIRALFELKTASKSSPVSMRMLLTKSKTHVKALQSLGEPVDWHEMLIYILTSKLDKDTRTVWEQSLENGIRPTTKDLFTFLSKYACDAEPVNLVTHSENQTHRTTKKEKFSASFKPTRTTQGYVSTSHEPQCVICKGAHQVACCPKFLALNPSGRYSAARNASLCINCLRAGHWGAQCRSSSCRRCQGRHHTLLHSDSATKESPNIAEDASAPSTSQNCSATLTAVTRSEILLSTARIKIIDNLNKEHECRVLLDSGSQTNFITERFANHLQLPKARVYLPAFGIGQKATKICHKVKTEIRSRNSFFSQRVEFMVIPNITTHLPSQTVNRVALNIPSNLSLADPHFHEPAEIDALLGEQLFYKLLSYGQIRLSNKTTILQKTKLGWIVSGSAESINSSTNIPISHLVQLPLEEQITKFWEIEECPSKKEFSHEEEECERRFRTETTRDHTGRYIVRLPFNEKKKQLGVSYNLARKRFLSLERRLNREPTLREPYSSFLKEYEELGHMTAIPDTNRHEGFYLPHHAVYKLSSVTTKIRVVFDGSAKSMSGISLNDTLLVGPKIQEDLFSLLARFRVHAYVFTADIEKMFRQIQVHPDDAIYQKTFVANRISSIQSHTHPSDWYHVQSADNPADVLSRGQSPSDFREGQHWFQGPFWLAGQEDDWPKFHLSHVEVPDKRVITLINRMEPNEILTRFSSFVKLQRKMAYILRFITNASRKRNLSGRLTCEELQFAHMRIITLVQSEVFPREIQYLGKNNTVHKSSKLFMLNPFLDEGGIIRVGGRLRNASITYNQKFPIILPRSHHVTRIIIQAAHIRNMHAGTIATLNDVRQRYWPIDGKNITRFIIHQCLRCFKTRPRTTDQYIMGILPKDRVTSIRPFKNVGVDYCGPFFIKEKRHRNQRKLKAYVAVFVCFATKAIHLELVSDLTTEAFLGCLKRFFARRGLATNIYSDNATNFTGAKKELEELKFLLNSAKHNEIVSQKLLIDNIKWHFSPPRAPHFGGLWEAAVKSFKHHFIRTIGDALFTFEQLNTYVIEVEAILNSRPLTPLSSDPNDLAALTPAHFLIGESVTTMPEHDLSDMPSNRLSHWQHIQRVKQHFWARWHKEYLNEVSLRSKWRTGSTIQLQVGDLVLLKEDNIPPLRWMLGRITATHPGEDGILRVVSVKTMSRTYKRSILKLCPLPRDPAI